MRKKYEERLKNLAVEIESFGRSAKTRGALHEIMDSVAFRDVETALLVARMNLAEEGGQRHG